jgi:hypothetical protein
MRYFLIATCAAATCILGGSGFPSVRPAISAECTGQNCPPPAGQGHDCEHKKQEQTTS